MLTRRPTATLVAMLLPLAAALTSCGFDYKTDRVNTIAGGVNNREASVEVLGARIIAYSAGQGRLIGTLVYSENDAEEPAVLDGLEIDGQQLTGLPKIEIGPNENVNLAGDEVDPIPVTGDFTAGDVVEVTYSFSTEEVVSAEVPVVKPCGQYAEITAPEGGSPEAEEESAAPEESESTEETGSTEPSGASEEESDATFLCDHATESAEEEGGH